MSIIILIKGELRMEIGIIGATGYSGIELIRILTMHPKINKLNFYALADYPDDISNYYPHLKGTIEGNIKKWDHHQAVKENDLLFFATPHGVSSELISEIMNEKIKIIDLSGDFRIKNEKVYQKWYKQNHPCFSSTQKFTYGLTEWNRVLIKSSNFISNPGCYPTASLLGIAPLVKASLIEENSIIIDAKSGISGAGKSLNSTTHFSNRNENLAAYKIHDHQHTPEIEQFLTSLNSKQDYISFTPHLIPMTRGIMTTIYANSKTKINTNDLRELYKTCYEDSYFIRVRDSIPDTKDVYGSNYCDIYVAYDERTNRITVISVIDNLIKGAAGQAVQNMNLLFNLPEETGLNLTPLFP